MTETKASGRINRGEEEMVGRGERDFECDSKCPDHSRVMAKQDQRDGDLKVIYNRLDRKVKWTTFTWIVGTLLTVFVIVATVYAQGVEKDVMATRQAMIDAKTAMTNDLSEIKNQNTRALNKMDQAIDQIRLLQIDMAKVQASVDRNRADLDKFNRAIHRGTNSD